MDHGIAVNGDKQMPIYLVLPRPNTAGGLQANAIYSHPTGDPMTTQSRRRLLQALASGTAAYTVPGLFAEALKTTVSLGEGPFYPDKMPMDTDNDLLVVNEGITPAVGEIAYVSGRVLTKSGEPLRNGYV